MNGLDNLETKLKEAIGSAIPQIVANTATEYFKERFSKKEWDGKPWKPWADTYRHRTNGSLMIDSGALVNSIRPSRITSEKVVIQAGNSKVGYAQVHNEGFIGSVVVKAHTRRRKGRTEKVRQYTRHANMPQRQFMGNSKGLQDKLKEDIEGYIKSIIK